MMKKLMFTLVFAVGVVSVVFADLAPADVRGAWFREARFGMFIHWGIYSIPAKGEWSYAYDSYKPGEYEAFAKRFNPAHYRPREWAKLAKAAGMKYAVLTSRHHDGFCMFDSHFTDYKITKTPYGKDAVREFVEAFRAEGLKVGFYHSLPDWTHPGYADTESPECMREGGKKVPHVPTPEQYAAFTNLVWNHVNQLTTEYGKIDLMFFDYTSRTKAGLDYFGRDRLMETVYRNQPDILINDRLAYFKDNCRDFDYYTPEICVPNQPQVVKGREVMWETCATMNDHWGYCRDDCNWKSPEAVVAGLVGCVSRNGNLLLNVGPTELGELPAGSVKILNALADWYKANGESVTGCVKSGFAPPHGCAYTQKGNALYCHFLQSPLGDTILPQLKGKIAKATLLRTGEDIAQIDHWGFELLKPDEQRIRTRAIRPGDVIRLDLASCVAADVLDIGTRRELFCDGLLIDAAKTTASRIVHHPDRLGQTVFVQDAPWEVCTSYGTILRDEKGYHLYYIVAMRSDPTDPQRYDPKWKDRTWQAVCYATSPDAIHWTRPILRRSAFKGSKENNILFGLDFCSVMDNFSAFIDTNPACPPSEKYKGLIQYSPDNTQTNMGLYWVAGPDPVNLTLRGKVVQRDDWGYAWQHGGILIDTQSTAFWDSAAGCYRCYTRGYHPADHDRNGDKHIRDIRTATSKDFRTWSAFRCIGFGPGAEDIPLYTNLIQPYPRAPQLLVGFPTRYVERQKWTPSYDALPGVAARRARMQTSVGKRAGLAVTDATFICSRDGITFQREDDAFLAPGPEGDCNWIYGDCYPYYGFVETPGRNGRDTEYSMFLFARDQEHNLSRVNRCTIRKDGFVSYHGTYRPQHLVTRPLVYRGGRLLLNFATSARGYVRLVIRAADGSGEARSCEIFGDATDREIVFEKGSPAALAGRPVTLDFELSDADVYSFAFAE